VKPPKPILFIAAVAALGLAAWFLLPKGAQVPLVQRGEAINGARWGDTRAEVEKAAGTTLVETAHRSQFHTVYSEAAASRSRSYSLTGYAFLGRLAEIVYVFLDGKLASYYVLATDSDPVTLDREVSGYLADRFGQHVAPVDEGPLTAIWQKQDYIVNYWFVQDSIRVTFGDKYTAVFGVIPRAVADGLID
jgi:hypothetical protein